MKFAIRDDDISFHTCAKELDYLYGDILSVCPVGFSCIPFVGGYDVDSYTKADWDSLDEAWRRWQTRQVRDIADNGDLVRLMRGWIEHKRASIMLHGIHHRQHELVVDHDITAEIGKAKHHLEQIFDCRIAVATPPNNSLSASSARALAANGMNIVMAFGHRPGERPLSWHNVWNFARIGLLYLRHGYRRRYPIPLNFGSHKEQASYEIGPNSRFEDFQEGLHYTMRHDGNFVVATHHYHLMANPALKELLWGLIESASELTAGDVKFVRPEELFD